MQEKKKLHSPSFSRLLLAVIFVFATSFAALSQIVTPFAIRHQTQQKGGLKFLSNVAVSCNSTQSSCTAATGQMPPAGTSMNNDFTENYVDIDGDPTTFMSSSDSLILPNCSEVTWAGLYWGGRIATSNSSYNQRSNVKIKVGSGTYQQITADQTINNTSGAVSYFCFKNVTSIVQNAGLNARFTIADQVNSVGSSNLFGG
ncbi:MAG: hypothetical protein RL078_1835, partial [Bacteroidota bacterium]